MVIPIIKYVIKNNDPNHISSFKDTLEYNQIKDLWLEFLKNKNFDKPIKKSFDNIKLIGELGSEIGALNIYNVRADGHLFGLYYSNGKTTYLKMKSDNVKKILNIDEDIMVLTYIVNLKNLIQK
jgi:hypothetical protein